MGGIGMQNSPHSPTNVPKASNDTSLARPSPPQLRKIQNGSSRLQRLDSEPFPTNTHAAGRKQVSTATIERTATLAVPVSQSRRVESSLILGTRKARLGSYHKGESTRYQSSQTRHDVDSTARVRMS